MEAPAPLLPYWSWPILAAGVSALGTALAIGYARRRALIDQPGRRRSHSVPTPRGGGIGIVVAALGLLGLLAVGASAAQQLALAGLASGLSAVAAVGWWDDHRSLPAWPKLAVHLLASVVCIACGPEALAISAGGPAHADLAATLGSAIVAVLALVWSVNLHNFMDGSNGLLAGQTAFVLGVLAALGAPGLSPGERAVCLGLAAAALAFLPFNFPRARVFMGDVGSGSLGLLVAAAALGSAQGRLWPLVLILDSAFVVDSAATLAVRVVRGRRWYSAHREHLYQWLVRGGFSHARVAGLYALWNLCVALPCALLYLHWCDLALPPAGRATLMPCALAAAVVGGELLLGGTLWWAGKRWCLRRARRTGANHAD